MLNRLLVLIAFLVVISCQSKSKENKQVKVKANEKNYIEQKQQEIQTAKDAMESLKEAQKKQDDQLKKDGNGCLIKE